MSILKNPELASFTELGRSQFVNRFEGLNRRAEIVQGVVEVNQINLDKVCFILFGIVAVLVVEIGIGLAAARHGFKFFVARGEFI